MRAAAVLPAAALLLHVAGQPVRPPIAPTAIVTTDVAVLDAAGSPVQGLGAKDFEISIGGEPAVVTRAVMASAGLSVVLIVDATTSQPLKRYEINSALATEWLPSLKPGDRARIGVLAAPLVLTAWLPSDPRSAALLARPLIERASLEPSPLWDATNAAIEALAGEKGAKVILIVSDGRSNANVLGLDQVADRAIVAGIAISSVSESGERMLAQAGDTATTIRPDASLQWLADETGGVYLPDGIARRSVRPQQDPFAYVRELVRTPNRPGPLLIQLTSAVRQRYRLSFSVPADGRVRRLDVKVALPGVTVHWRRRIMATSVGGGLQPAAHPAA
jgi:hypothetical protein